MANWTYNTEHGHFLLKKEKINAASDALWAFIRENVDYCEDDNQQSIEDALGRLNLEYSEDDEGNIIDIFLGDSYFGDVKEKAFKVLAPYVQPGSLLVFAFGGAEACWGLSFEKNNETDLVEMKNTDVETVAWNDMLRILQTLKQHAPGLYIEMRDKYARTGMQHDLEPPTEDPT